MPFPHEEESKMDPQKKQCPRCERELKADAPSGLCPSCLMEINLQSGVSMPGGGRSRIEPWPVEEVARRFPELEIVGLLGSGGMGAVYKARQPKLDRFVALKILAPERDDAGFVDRFSREAKTLARLDHPNIVGVHDFGEKDGIFFLIMELVDGVTLRDLLSEGRLKPEQALSIVPPMCEALQYAHDKGVVHRDIKPENILLDKEGRVKVADFGIARLAGTEAAGGLTGEGQVVGTAHYMAPEQVERPASVDHRADIYALGVVFYEMLTGELPLGRFPNPSKKVQIDVRLDEVVLKALEKEPEQRYQQASEVRTRVETIAGTAGQLPPEAKMGGEEARRLLLLPSIGLTVVGGLNALVVVIVLFGVLDTGGGPFIGPFLILGLGASLILFGAFQMMHLQSYRAAVAASICAMVTPPGFLIGIPVGVWALVVLSRREVRAVFPKRDKVGREGESPVAKRVLWTSAAILAVFLIVGIVVVVGGVIASIAIPAFHRSHDGVILGEEISVRSVGQGAELSWGPIIERVVRDDGEAQDFFINLDTGELHSPPADLDPQDMAAVQQWIARRGIDAMGETGTSVRGLVGFEMMVRPFPKQRWENAAPAEVYQDVSLQGGSAGSHTFLSAKGDLPETFIFRTREGARGILQITEFTEEPRGVKIRYKLAAGEGRPPAAAVGSDPRATRDIAGTWQIVSMHDGGNEAPPDILAQMGPWDISDDRIRFTFRGRAHDFAYALDPAQEPAWIDIEETDMFSARGIYKVEGDLLTICHPEGNLTQRATDFVSEPSPSPNDMLLVLRRVETGLSRVPDRQAPPVPRVPSVPPVPAVPRVPPVPPVPPAQNPDTSTLQKLARFLRGQQTTVVVTQHGPDHLSYRGAGEEFIDACRSAMQELSYKEQRGPNTTYYRDLSEGVSSSTEDGGIVASRGFLRTVGEDGSNYGISIVKIRGEDPVVMLESTSPDRHRLINTLLGEFHRRGFQVEAGR
jgi:uncharacterized protein (TIGR03067 family)